MFFFISKWVANLYALESLAVGHDIFKNHSFVLPRTKSCSQLMLCLFLLKKAPLVITHFIHPWNMDSFLSLQPQCLKTTFFKREVTLKVSEIYGEVLLLQLSVFHLKQSSLMLLLLLLLLLYFLSLLIMLCFKRH